MKRITDGMGRSQESGVRIKRTKNNSKVKEGSTLLEKDIIRHLALLILFKRLVSDGTSSEV
jgi:hypothetical protein